MRMNTYLHIEFAHIFKLIDFANFKCNLKNETRI